jgi:acetyl-CoA carboxylase carboxyltransferase component
VSLQSANNNQETFREDISEYVAQLQLHMTLQARNLVPDLTDINSSRHQLLQETQAMIEKLASRQSHKL